MSQLTDYRALCAELLAEIDAKAWGIRSLPSSDAIDRARAALAQPEPEGPTDEEMEEAPFLYAPEWYNNEMAAAWEAGRNSGWRDALARWGRPALKPGPVSERLPGPEDVNDDGEVWVEEPPYDYALGDTGDYDREPGRWVLRPLSSLDKRDKRRWLAHHALPVPEVTP